jgi:hypothetical protein
VKTILSNVVSNPPLDVLEAVVQCKWLWEEDELENFPPLMECQSSHSGRVDAIRKEMLMIDRPQLARVMDDFKRRIGNLNDMIIFHTRIPNSNGMSLPLIL